MIVVISCAGSKNPNAGTLKKKDGTPVEFVVLPDQAPSASGLVHARPDDEADDGETWREKLLKYNGVYRDTPRDNPNGLLPAWKLYSNSIYGRLANKFGVENLYILSAGWGLIRADFLTPKYNITFSEQRDKKWAIRDYDYDSLFRDNDFCELPDDLSKPVVFFGGLRYVPLFCGLTETLNISKVVFYSAQIPPEAPSCKLVRYSGKGTNWHYRCAQDFIDGKIQISDCN